MRNKVAKALRKEAGAQTSTSNRLGYQYAKAEHKAKFHPEPKFNLSRRQQRLGLIQEHKEKVHKQTMRILGKLFKKKNPFYGGYP